MVAMGVGLGEGLCGGFSCVLATIKLLPAFIPFLPRDLSESENKDKNCSKEAGYQKHLYQEHIWEHHSGSLFVAKRRKKRGMVTRAWIE